MKRRRQKRYTSRKKQPFAALFLLALVAVGTGYFGVKYVVSPWMDAQSQPLETAIIEDQIETVTTRAYAVQFGSFSTVEAAKMMVEELKVLGVESKVQKRDNAWKVVSEGFSTKEEAREAAVTWREWIPDAFVVGI